MKCAVTFKKCAVLFKKCAVTFKKCTVIFKKCALIFKKSAVSLQGHRKVCSSLCMHIYGSSGQVESKFLKTQKFQPLAWFRYIDDIFFFWTHGENSLKNFMIEFNTFNPNIKFTYDFSEAIINFLDLNVKLSNGKFQTSLYVKPTDCHQYLHFQSSHLKHTKSSIAYSQTLRFSRACSQEEDYKNYCNWKKQIERGTICSDLSSVT